MPEYFFAGSAMAAFGKCLYKKSCDLNCQVFINTNTNVTPQSICLACNHLAAFHEQLTERLVDNNEAISKPQADNLAKPTSTSAAGCFGKAKSFSGWLQDKRSDEFRQTKRTKKRKVDGRKGGEGDDEVVTINFGLMERKDDQLKKVWGKRLPIKIQKCSTYANILETAIHKWSAYYSNFMQNKEYVLLYEDGNRARFMPGGTKEFFNLSKYKEEIGRDYRRICLYLCTEEDYDTVWESCLVDQGKTAEEVSFFKFFLGKLGHSF